MDQAKGDLLLGTDFRHAVEFSRSGRARSPTNCLAVLRGGSSTVHQVPQQSNLSGFIRRFPRPWGPVRSRLVHAERYTRSEGLCTGGPDRLSKDRPIATDQGGWAV